jgi:hypothetical protein
LNKNISFYDQEQFLVNSKKNFWGKIGSPFVGESDTIFSGIPFYNASTLSVQIDQTSKLCDQPIENGAVITEHKVIQPKRVTCSIAMPNFLAGAVINELQKYFYESKKIIIQTVAGTYTNMIVENMPTKMDSSNVDRPIYDVTFRELILVEPDDGNDNENMINNDTQKVSVYSDLLNNAPIADSIIDYLGGF